MGIISIKTFFLFLVMLHRCLRSYQKKNEANKLGSPVNLTCMSRFPIQYFHFRIFISAFLFASFFLLIRSSNPISNKNRQALDHPEIIRVHHTAARLSSTSVTTHILTLILILCSFL